jgi:hypothetical protein
MQVMIWVEAGENSKERVEGMDAMTAAAGSDGAGGCGVLSDRDESEAEPADEQTVKSWKHLDRSTRTLSEMEVLTGEYDCNSSGRRSPPLLGLL